MSYQSWPLSERLSSHKAFSKANLKASMSWREAESLLCSINQPSNSAKEPFIHLTASLSILKTSFDLDCSLHVCYIITEASILSTDNNKKHSLMHSHTRIDICQPERVKQLGWACSRP